MMGGISWRWRFVALYLGIYAHYIHLLQASFRLQEWILEKSTPPPPLLKIIISLEVRHGSGFFRSIGKIIKFWVNSMKKGLNL